jgi:hypothetical protein
MKTIRTSASLTKLRDGFPLKLTSQDENGKNINNKMSA